MERKTTIQNVENETKRILVEWKKRNGFATEYSALMDLLKDSPKYQKVKDILNKIMEFEKKMGIENVE